MKNNQGQNGLSNIDRKVLGQIGQCGNCENMNFENTTEQPCFGTMKHNEVCDVH